MFIDAKLAGRRSKLELYVSTIDVLSNNGATNISSLTLKTKINISPLKAILSDLMAKKLVEERQISGRTVYVTTPKARNVLSLFKDLAHFLPIG